MKKTTQVRTKVQFITSSTFLFGVKYDLINMFTHISRTSFLTKKYKVNISMLYALK